MPRSLRGVAGRARSVSVVVLLTTALGLLTAQVARPATTPSPSPTSGHGSDHYQRLVDDFRLVVVVAAIVLVLGIVGLVLSRDGRRRGRHR